MLSSDVYRANRDAIMTESTLRAHYSDAELLAWLDGSREYAEHIEECEACRQRALALRLEDNRLHSLLYRAECPPALTLAEYGIGLLSEEDRRAIRVHVDNCPLCSQELAWQQQFMRSLLPEEAPAPSLGDQLQAVREGVRVIVAQWVNRLAGGAGTGPGMGMQFAMGPMRGNNQRPMLFDAGELQVTLEFYEDVAHPGRHQLVGLLVGEEDPDLFRVQLWRGKDRVAEATVDELGNFIIDNLPPDQYNLKLIHPKLEIQLNDLEI